MFADDLELASYLEQQRIEKGVEEALARKPIKPPFIKKCHNCDEPLGTGLRFCDGHCRDDYEHRMLRRKVNG